MSIEIYLASVATLAAAILLPLFLFMVWRGVAKEGDERGGAIAVTVFLLFGAFSLIPLLWWMAVHQAVL